MSTSSANATALRAGASALSLPVLPAMAWTPGPIEAMWPEYLRLEAALDAAATRAMDAEELYDEPERPRWHPFHEEGGYVTIATTPGRGISVLDNGAENIAYLKEAIAREHEPDDPDVGYRNEVRARRARKTLAKIEAWHAEVKRRKDAAGLTEAEAADREASRTAGACRAAIFAMKATTFRELAYQAAILDVDWRQERAESVIERLAELAGVAPYGIG